MKTTLPNRYLPTILLLCILCYAWGVLVIQHGELLFAIQDFSPWMGTDSYLQQHIGHPGGMREWLGDWLTQLFYYPWLGGTLLVSCWGLSLVALILTYRLKSWWQMLAALPWVALLASITELGYWIFCLKSPSYWFGPTLGLLAVSTLLLVYSRCGKRVQLLTLGLTALAGYPLLGWYATLACLCMLLSSLLQEGQSELKQTGLFWLKRIGILLTACIGLALLYHHSPHIHWREEALTYGFHHMSFPEASSLLMEMPFWVMAASLLLLPLLARLQHHKGLNWLPLLLLAVTLTGGNMLNYRNQNFHTELRMMRALDEARWDDVLTEMHDHGQRPTREMVIMKDVALAQQGRLGEAAFDYPIGGLCPQMNTELPIHMAHSAAPLFYYWLGIPNFAFMWCMENNIEYGLSPFYLRMMYRCMCVNGEEEAALKYKRLLETTLFYKNYEMAPDEQESVQRFMTGHDQLTNDRGYSEKYLLERLSREHYDTPEAQQLTVHFAILARDLTGFERALARYQELLKAQPSGQQRLPKYFNRQTFDWYYGSNTGNKSY